MKKYLLLAVCLLVLLTSCGIVPAALVAPTPVPTFPPRGEWAYQGNGFGLVLDIQQANDSTIVASLTSIVKTCNGAVYDPMLGRYLWEAYNGTNVSNAIVTIKGRNIHVIGAVMWGFRSMTFSGVINSDGSLSLVSSDLNGVQDYLFHPATNAVAQLQQQYQQGTCS